MAYISTTGHGSVLVERVRAVLEGLANGFAAYSEQRARTDQMQRLNNMSDAELAQLGLTREQIPYHVFRDRFGL